MRNIFKIIRIWLYLLLFSFRVNAQECGTISGPNTILAADVASADIAALTGPNLTVRYFVHVVRSTAGVTDITQTMIDNAFNATVHFYSDNGICLSKSGQDFIDNSAFLMPYGSTFPSSSIIATSNNINAIDIYILLTDVLYAPTLNVLGFATGITSKELFIDGRVISNATGLNYNTLPHEIGHCFSLYHTHHGTCIENPADLTECPESTITIDSGCGDFIGDTPADPNLSNSPRCGNVAVSARGTYNSTSCIWTPNISWAAYHPHERNIMSYAPHRPCRNQFTIGQVDRMKYAITTSSILIPTIVPDNKSIAGLTMSSGSQNYFLKDYITSSNLNITTTANLNFKAGNYIEINPTSTFGPFTTTGSFTATIEPVCNSITVTNNAKMAISQDTFPYRPMLKDCLSWVTTHATDFGFYSVMQHIINGDTTIGGLVYKKIDAKYLIPISSLTFNYYYREDIVNKKVYSYELSFGIESIIYDFDKVEGEILFDGFIDSITYEVLEDGISYKNFWVMGEVRLIEGLGQIGTISIGEEATSYECYRDGNQSIISISPFCDTIQFDSTFCKRETTLALHLQSFKATATCDNVSISWTASQDESLSHYIVQRSSDGTQWLDIAQVPTQGGSQAYHYTDAYEASQNTYYRIASIATNGASDYSQIITAKNTCGNENPITITPNPSSGVFAIQSLDNSIISIDVLDVQGKIITSKTVQAFSTSIDISNAAQGLYFVRITTDKGTLQTYKMVKR